MSEYNIKQVLEEWELEDHIREVIEQLTADRQEAIKALRKIGFQLNNNDGTGERWLRERLTECRCTALAALAKLKTTKDE